MMPYNGYRIFVRKDWGRDLESVKLTDATITDFYRAAREMQFGTKAMFKRNKFPLEMLLTIDFYRKMLVFDEE